MNFIILLITLLGCGKSISNINKKKGLGGMLASQCERKCRLELEKDNFDSFIENVEKGKISLNDPVCSCGETQLLLQLKKGDFERVKKLLQMGANAKNARALKNDFGVSEHKSSLDVACSHGEKITLEIIELLIERGAESSVNGRSLLKAVKSNASYEVIECLVGNGQDVNYTYGVNLPIIMYAILNNRIRVVTLLLDKGANIEVINRYYKIEFNDKKIDIKSNLIDVACTGCSKENIIQMFDLLREKGLKPNIDNMRKYLHIVAIEKGQDVLKHILEELSEEDKKNILDKKPISKTEAGIVKISYLIPLMEYLKVIKPTNFDLETAKMLLGTNYELINFTDSNSSLKITIYNIVKMRRFDEFLSYIEEKRSLVQN